MVKNEIVKALFPGLLPYQETMIRMIEEVARGERILVLPGSTRGKSRSTIGAMDEAKGIQGYSIDGVIIDDPAERRE